MSNEVRPSAILVKAQKGRREGHGQKYTYTYAHIYIYVYIYIHMYAYRMAVSVIRMIVVYRMMRIDQKTVSLSLSLVI